MKKALSSEYIMEGWFKKYHGLTVQELITKEPELIKTPDWYKKYQVTQEQHDEWYDWAVSELGKNLRMPKTRVKRYFTFEYLNLAPSIKQD